MGFAVVWPQKGVGGARGVSLSGGGDQEHVVG